MDLWRHVKRPKPGKRLSFPLHRFQSSYSAAKPSDTDTPRHACPTFRLNIMRLKAGNAAQAAAIA